MRSAIVFALQMWFVYNRTRRADFGTVIDERFTKGENHEENETRAEDEGQGSNSNVGGFVVHWRAGTGNRYRC